MATLAHALLGIPSHCGLCRAVPTRKKEVGNLSGPWALNAADALIVIHSAPAHTTVEIPVACYQVTASFH
ncbi:hypothetical protein FF1_039694 [Malus domestica]